MNSSNTFTYSMRTRAFVLACSLAVTALQVTGTITVGAQSMQDMPGMDMGQPKGKLKPKPKPTPQKKKQQTPAPKKDDMGGMDMAGFRMIPAGIGLMKPATAPRPA